MTKLLKLLILIPIAIVLIVLSVANRQLVSFSLDPFNTEAPAVSFELPFFVFLFLATLTGMVLGSVATWLKQGAVRKKLRDERATSETLRHETDILKKSLEVTPVEIAPGLPAITSTKNAA
ncbi:MAG: DUF1049 domain-containing protein [Rhizobiaceae bacterium]|nr:DUF1049 domain-containing protein [Rhizobiaceae bacterium]MBL4696648.1 DUF1049 domain-containing protein [Rhizobiaceae bacterium]MBL4732189.1 DUF1049 domain-containing protein [Rhizobiaceae bacterium]